MMESFSLLKYWRGCGGGGGGGAAIRSFAAAFAAAVIRPSVATTEDEGDEDEGPFFDLEFTSLSFHDGSSGASNGHVDKGEFKLKASSVGDRDGFAAPADLLLNGKVVSLEPSSIVITASNSDVKPYFPGVSLLRSATRFRVFFLGLRKAKPTAAEPSAAAAALATASTKQQQSRFFVKFKVDEVPIISLFARDNGGSRNIPGCRATKPPPEGSVAAATSAEDKTLAREVVQKYLNMIKPLYARGSTSRRHCENLRLPREPAPAKSGLITAVPAASGGGGKNLQAGLKSVGKRLRKSRSASEAITPQPRRRDDDSLRELNEGIQSAIAHCKRSLIAPVPTIPSSSSWIWSPSVSSANSSHFVSAAAGSELPRAVQVN
ncbi:putative membrane-associated kinase regulator 2 [Canna indica]|uniref:Membrane-associated kinase regulator 2 n=1 Tax=Canna indica TaxID=4628 RepID=A0AAQ3JVP4_9LILI|nr:putative membrane-associated kinase regulator 2 [Canna indica]